MLNDSGTSDGQIRDNDIVNTQYVVNDLTIANLNSGNYITSIGRTSVENLSTGESGSIYILSSSSNYVFASTIVLTNGDSIKLTSANYKPDI